MSEYIIPTGGPEDPFYRLWQRVRGRQPEPEKEYRQREEDRGGEETLIRSLLEQVRRRRRLCCGHPELRRWACFCRKEEEILSAALFLRTGGREKGPEREERAGPLADRLRRLTLLFQQSGRDYARLIRETEDGAFAGRLRELEQGCRCRGEETERLLGRLLVG